MITNIPDRERDLQAQVDALTEELERLRAQEPVALKSVHLIRDVQGMCAVLVNGRMAIRDNGDIIDHFATLDWFAAPPAQPADLIEMSPEFTDTARSALLWVLWHHQGGSSKVGQPIRFALGMGQHEHLSDYQIREAKRWGALPQTVTAQPAEPTIDEQVASVNAVFDAWRNGEDATLTLGLAAQPAHPDEFACPLCFDDPANIKPAKPVQLTETEIFKAYTTATGKVLPNKWGVREELVAITRIVERAHGIEAAPKATK